MLKRSIAITMTIGTLAVGGGVASALADGGPSATTTTGATTTTIDTTATNPVAVTPTVSDIADEQSAVNDVTQAANDVQGEAVAQTADDNAGDQQNASDLSEEPGDDGQGDQSGNSQSDGGNGGSAQVVSSSSTPSGGE